MCRFGARIRQSNRCPSGFHGSDTIMMVHVVRCNELSSHNFKIGCSVKNILCAGSAGRTRSEDSRRSEREDSGCTVESTMVVQYWEMLLEKCHSLALYPSSNIRLNKTVRKHRLAVRTMAKNKSACWRSGAPLRCHISHGETRKKPGTWSRQCSYRTFSVLTS